MIKVFLLTLIYLFLLPTNILASAPSWKIAVLIYKNSELDFPGQDIPITNIQGQYFNNTDLSGTPALTRSDGKIDFDWSNSKPAPEINQNSFSVRWTGNFNPGSSKDLYFNIEADDGIRVYIDGNLIVDEWRPQYLFTYKIQNAQAGNHDIKVEYFQGSGGAMIHFFISEAKHSSFQMTSGDIQLIKDVFAKIPPKILSWSANAVSLNYDVKEIDRPVTTVGNPVKKGWWWASPSVTKTELDTLSNYDSVYVFWPNKPGDFCTYIGVCGNGYGLKPSEWTKGMTYAVTQGTAGTKANDENDFIHEWMHGVQGFFEDYGFIPQPGMDQGESTYNYTPQNDPDGSRYITDNLQKKVLDPITGNLIGIGSNAFASGKPTNLGILKVKSLSPKSLNFLDFPFQISASQIYSSFIERGLNILGFSLRENAFWETHPKDLSNNFNVSAGKKYFSFWSNGQNFDLQTYFPNDDLISSYYLFQNQPAKVLWFEKQSQGVFLMYNYAPWDPKSRCHYDKFSWDNGLLKYFETRDQCTDVDKDTIYDPPITFLPKQWNSTQSWKYAGSSKVKVNKNNSIVCTGNNNYQASIIGLEKVSNITAIHFRTNQLIKWDNFGECAGWQNTRWQEDYWFTDSMPVESGGNAKGILKTTGGNLDNSSDTWNITFDKWRKLP